MASSPTEVEAVMQRGLVGGMIPPVPPAPMEEWFDRSSITIDAMVTIEGVSEEDWWRYAPEGRVCEFLDGVVYMPSPASPEHQDQTSFWLVLLKLFVRRRNLGKVSLGPGVLRLAPGRNPEPDVFVVPSGPGPHNPPAYLVVEVLSKSTRSHDTGRKLKAFQEARIPEIVYVDEVRSKILVHRRVGDAYETQALERGIWHSEAVPGFWMDVAWLWESPLPDDLECLGRILAGPPE